MRKLNDQIALGEAALGYVCGDPVVWQARAAQYQMARLEWAVDDANRAADADGSPDVVLAALANIPANQVAAQSFALDPSCRFVTSPFPVLRIWQVHQPTFAGDISVRFETGTDWLLVRREAGAVVIERLTSGDYALLRALHEGCDLATALGAAIAAEVTFDLGTTLRHVIANRTLTELRAG